MSSQKQGKVFIPPINLIFKYLQSQSLVSIQLYEQIHFRIEGIIKGFDEFMNIVLENAVEVREIDGKRIKLGKILLKGDNVVVVSSLDV
ncbi:hypothetical protein WICPIJ_001867 [Wickerhamomyces pijperi]|uniref:Small nuclear ribonucleoprotein E n=1 Tax=Wickerhamomyces pijperi TaxID=599730 RepID=A0A9P8QA10_WICPI|nr:hypothetical protein WICPIJ_001867 [Wickerhamomyces pijperi]